MQAYFSTSVCISFLALFILVGCSGESETKSNAGSTTNAPKSDTSTSSSANKQETGPSIPDDFPKDVHVAAGATATSFEGSDGAGNLILEYPESEIDVFIKSYLEGMVQLGWNQVTSSQLPIGTITNFSKDDRKCTISISPPKEKVIKVAIAPVTTI